MTAFTSSTANHQRPIINSHHQQPITSGQTRVRAKADYDRVTGWVGAPILLVRALDTLLAKLSLPHALRLCRSPRSGCHWLPSKEKHWSLESRSTRKNRIHSCVSKYTRWSKLQSADVTEVNGRISCGDRGMRCKWMSARKGVRSTVLLRRCCCMPSTRGFAISSHGIQIPADTTSIVCTFCCETTKSHYDDM